MFIELFCFVFAKSIFPVFNSGNSGEYIPNPCILQSWLYGHEQLVSIYKKHRWKAYVAFSVNFKVYSEKEYESTSSSCSRHSHTIQNSKYPNKRGVEAPWRKREYLLLLQQSLNVLFDALWAGDRQVSLNNLALSIAQEFREVPL